jgi:cytochrome c-type biogenesis protein CcmH/NrfF
VLGIALVAAAFWWLGWIVWILPVTALLLAVTVAWARRRPRAG